MADDNASEPKQITATLLFVQEFKTQFSLRGIRIFA
jgi:hypothetical protein